MSTQEQRDHWHKLLAESVADLQDFPVARWDLVRDENGAIKFPWEWERKEMSEPPFVLRQGKFDA